MPYDSSSLQVSFWGVRGSIPSPHREMERYGGNTSCVEVISPDGTRFILDCGTGLRLLGNHLAAASVGRPEVHVEAHILVTHYHWDHIQGIPFFPPLFSAASRLWFYGFQSEYLGPDSLRKALESQVTKPYFPGGPDALGARREFREIEGGADFQIGGTRVRTCWLNHPQECLTFRLDSSAGSVVYATDHEPGDAALDAALLKHARGADLLIADAQYSPKEEELRRGWGHSTWSDAAKLARESKARNLVLFHHDPNSTDAVIDGYLHAARKEFPSTWAAAEQMTFRLSGGRVEVGVQPAPIAGPGGNPAMSQPAAL
jgi:phosphoribosyl 1,2-cyclic phosphodiesterase